MHIHLMSFLIFFLRKDIFRVSFLINLKQIKINGKQFILLHPPPSFQHPRPP